MNLQISKTQPLQIQKQNCELIQVQCYLFNERNAHHRLNDETRGFTSRLIFKNSFASSRMRCKLLFFCFIFAATLEYFYKFQSCKAEMVCCDARFQSASRGFSSPSLHTYIRKIHVRRDKVFGIHLFKYRAALLGGPFRGSINRGLYFIDRLSPAL